MVEYPGGGYWAACAWSTFTLPLGPSFWSRGTQVTWDQQSGGR